METLRDRYHEALNEIDRLREDLRYAEALAAERLQELHEVRRARLDAITRRIDAIRV